MRIKKVLIVGAAIGALAPLASIGASSIPQSAPVVGPAAQTVSVQKAEAFYVCFGWYCRTGPRPGHSGGW